MSDTWMRTVTYPTAMRTAAWTMIQPYVALRAQLGAPRTVCLRGVIHALFYMQRTGCQWEIRPRDVPPHATV